MSKTFKASVSVNFLERYPRVPVLKNNPYQIAKFYKDLAEENMSLYSMQDYQKVHQLFAAAAVCNGRVDTLTSNGCTLTSVFSFTDEGNREEFNEYVAQRLKEKLTIIDE